MDHRGRIRTGSKTYCCCLFLVVSSTFVITTTLRAQEQVERSSSIQAAKKSHKKSGTTITVNLEFEDGVQFQATQFTGDPIRVSRNGATVAVIPELTDGHVMLRLHNATIEANSALSLGDSLGSIQVGKEPAPFVQDGIKFQIRLLDVTIRKSDGNLSQATLGDIGTFGDSQCCLTCSGTTVCGCSVTGTCGSCCSGSCCG